MTVTKEQTYNTDRLVNDTPMGAAIRRIVFVMQKEIGALVKNDQAFIDTYDPEDGVAVIIANIISNFLYNCMECKAKNKIDAFNDIMDSIAEHAKLYFQLSMLKLKEGKPHEC